MTESTPPSPHLRAFLLATFAIFALSPDGLLVRLFEGGEWPLLFWRGGFSFVAILIYLWVTEPGGPVRALRATGWPGLFCAALMAVGIVMFIASLTRTAVANTLLMLSMVPFFAAGLGLVFLREAVPGRTWLAIAAALVGMAVILSGSLGGIGIVGDGLAVGTALCMAGSLVIIRANKRVSMLPALALSGLFVALAGLAMADPLAVGWRDIGLAAVMGVMQQAFAIGLYLSAARYLPPAEAGLIGLIETVVGPVWVWLALREVPGEAALAGGAIVLVALTLHFAAGLRAARGGATAAGR